MATFIEAYTQYGPRIAGGNPAQSRDLTRRLADTTGQHRGEIMRVLYSLQDSLLHFNREGRSVELPGLGSIQPVLKGDGRIRVRFRPDSEYLRALDNLKLFEGEILNAENIGFSPEAFKELWDAEHPDNPMELPARAA